MCPSSLLFYMCFLRLADSHMYPSNLDSMWNNTQTSHCRKLCKNYLKISLKHIHRSLLHQPHKILGTLSWVLTVDDIAYSFNKWLFECRLSVNHLVSRGACDAPYTMLMPSPPYSLIFCFSFHLENFFICEIVQIIKPVFGNKWFWKVIIK